MSNNPNDRWTDGMVDAVISDLDRRISGAQPVASHRYPRSVRHHGAWVDGRIVTPRIIDTGHASVDYSEVERLAKIKRDDRRAFALVCLIGCVVLAAFLLAVATY